MYAGFLLRSHFDHHVFSSIVIGDHILNPPVIFYDSSELSSCTVRLWRTAL